MSTEPTNPPTPVFQKVIDDLTGEIKISYRDSRKKVIKMICDRIQSGKPATLLAFNSAISQAIWTATCVKSQIGNLHELVSLSEAKHDSKIVVGIRITLSHDQLDTSDVGYQAVQEKDFWPNTRLNREELQSDSKPPKKRKSAKEKKAAENVPAVVAKTAKKPRKRKSKAKLEAKETQQSAERSASKQKRPESVKVRRYQVKKPPVA